METFNIQLVRGDDWADLKARWLDSTGTPVPIASARLQVRSKVNDATVLLELATGGNGITIDSSQYVIPTISAAQSAALETGVWDLEVTSSAGKVKTLIGGKLVVTPDVSR